MQLACVWTEIFMMETGSRVFISESMFRIVRKIMNIYTK